MSTVAVHSLRYEHALSTLRTIVGDPAKLVEERCYLKIQYMRVTHLIKGFKQGHLG